MKRRKYYFLAEILYSIPTVSMHPMEQEYDTYSATWLFRSVNKRCARRWVNNLMEMFDGTEKTTLMNLKRITKQEYDKIYPTVIDDVKITA